MYPFIFLLYNGIYQLQPCVQCDLQASYMVPDFPFLMKNLSFFIVVKMMEIEIQADKTLLNIGYFHPLYW